MQNLDEVNGEKRIMSISCRTDWYSRSGVYTYQNDYFISNQIEFLIPEKIFSMVRCFWKKRKTITRHRGVFFIKAPSTVAGIFVRILSREAVIMDVGWSSFGSAIHRNQGPFRFLKLLRIYTLDFLTFHCAHLLLVESREEKVYITNKFKIPERKIEILRTGFNSKRFESVSSTIPKELDQTRLDAYRKIFLMRAKNNPEAQINLAIEWFRKCCQGALLIIVTDSDKGLNVEDDVFLVLISRHVSESELKYLYEKCDVVLGHFGTNARIQRTIPHRFYESEYFYKPFLTRRSISVEEMKNPLTYFFDSKEQFSKIVNGKTIEKKFVRSEKVSLTEIEASQVQLQTKFNSYFKEFLSFDRK